MEAPPASPSGVARRLLMIQQFAHVRLRRMPGRWFVLARAPFALGYLVDPASSHMLVSKIKPCMSKYKRLYCETANGSLNQLWFI